MSVHVVIHKAEDESQESAGCPACDEGLVAVPSLALPPTPAVIVYSPASCPHLMSLPERSGGAGRADRVWTLTLTAAGHVQGRLQPRSSGPSRLPRLQPSRRPPQAYFSHPVMGGRAVHPVTWAGPQSSRALSGSGWKNLSAPVTTCVDGSYCAYNLSVHLKMSVQESDPYPGVYKGVGMWHVSNEACV